MRIQRRPRGLFLEHSSTPEEIAILGQDEEASAVSDHDSIKGDEQLAIEGEVARFVRDVERRANRAGKLGCAWLVFVALIVLNVRTVGGFITWAFFSVASFVALSRFLKIDTSRSIAEFQTTFRSIGGDARRRELALNYLRTLAEAPGRKPNKHAQKLLDGLGLPARPPTPVVRVLADDGARALMPLQAPPVVTPQASTPRASPYPVPHPAHTAFPAPSHPARSAHARAPSPTHTTHPTPSSPMHTAPSPAASASPYHRSEPAPMADSRAPASPRVLGPPPSAPEVRVPAATSAPRPTATTAPTSAPRMDEVVSWRCDACGTEARVSRAEAHRLCPTCFPQIRLDV